MWRAPAPVARSTRVPPARRCSPTSPTRRCTASSTSPVPSRRARSSSSSPVPRNTLHPIGLQPRGHVRGPRSSSPRPPLHATAGSSPRSVQPSTHQKPIVSTPWQRGSRGRLPRSVRRDGRPRTGRRRASPMTSRRSSRLAGLAATVVLLPSQPHRRSNAHRIERGGPAATSRSTAGVEGSAVVDEERAAPFGSTTPRDERIGSTGVTRCRPARPRLRRHDRPNGRPGWRRRHRCRRRLLTRRGPGRGAGREGRRRRSHPRGRRGPAEQADNRRRGWTDAKCACVDAGLDDQAVDHLQAHEQHDDPGEAVHTGERRRDEHRRQAAENDPQRRNDAEPTDDEAQQERGVEAEQRERQPGDQGDSDRPGEREQQVAPDQPRRSGRSRPTCAHGEPDRRSPPARR